MDSRASELAPPRMINGKHNLERIRPNGAVDEPGHSEEEDDSSQDDYDEEAIPFEGYEAAEDHEEL